jgi:hypothetical protein
MSENSKIEWTDHNGLPTVTSLAYIAGMIDGDGYITINRSVRAGRVYHAPQVGIAGTRREPHDLASSLWGGKVSRHLPKNPAHRPQFQWSRQGEAAAIILRAILPFLLVKVEHAWLALELWDHIEEGKSDDPFPWFGPSFDPSTQRDDMRNQMIDLNQSRNRARRAGRHLDGRTHDEFPEVR